MVYKINNFIKRRLKTKLELFLKIFLVFLTSFLTIFSVELFLTELNYPFIGCNEIHKVQEAYFGHYDEDTGWSYNALTSYYGVYEGVEHHFDSQGIRVLNHQQDFDNDRKKILFIGDSVTFGTGLNYQDGFVYKIEEKLNQDFDMNIQAINLGVQGFGTDQSYLQLKKFINLYEPVAVVYTFIPDHLYLRNLNANRRIHFKCLEFPGTKPRFTLTDESIILTKKPVDYREYDKYKTLALINDFADHLYEKMIKKGNRYFLITDRLIERIDSLSKDKGAIPLYIFYDNFDSEEANMNNTSISKILFKDKDRKVLNFFGWSNSSLEPFISEEDGFHPSASTSSDITDAFIEHFAQDIYSHLNTFQE